ncbi:MAG: ATP-binding protein [Thermodesulfobacteriota bacterium]
MNLKTKFTLGAVLVILILGLFIEAIFQALIFPAFSREFERHGMEIAHEIAMRARPYLLTGDNSRLQRLLSRKIAAEDHLSYLIILGKGQRLLAHTFNHRPADELVLANTVPPGQGESKSIIVLEKRNPPSIDIALAVQDGHRPIGTIRVGLNKRFLDKRINQVNLLALAMVFFVIITAIGADYGLNKTIIQPITHLSRLINEVAQGNFALTLPSRGKIACWEMLDCPEDSCPAYGNMGVRCWFTPGTRCRRHPSQHLATKDMKLSDKLTMCRQCKVFSEFSGDEVTQLTEAFTSMVQERKKAEETIKSYSEALDRQNEDLKTQTGLLTEKNKELEKTVAELKEAQSSLLQSEKMASIGQLAAGVAHEINNPVGFINSNLNSLEEYRRDLSEIIQAYLELEQLIASNPMVAADKNLTNNLETIRGLKDKMDLDFILNDLDKIIEESKEGTERIRKIVQDLKDFSHVDQAELRYADINKGLESTLNIVWNEIKYKATVTKEYGDIPEVCCYPQQVNQVFMNILVNAAQAIKEKGEIKITTAALNGDRPMIEIRISDTGEGIPKENLGRIFNPFFTTKPVGKGTGLGLSMAYNIVKKHDGQIEVESEEGKGTTFIIRLPVHGPGNEQGD